MSHTLQFDVVIYHILKDKDIYPNITATIMAKSKKRFKVENMSK